jgi:uncharacterized protein with GYD domain
MDTFVMLTRVSHEEMRSPQGLASLEQKVMAQVRSQCPEVSWLHSYAVLGPYDYLDIFEAPDVAAAMRVATLIRTFGHAESEVWPAAAWGAFKEMLHELPREAGEHVPAVAAH